MQRCTCGYRLRGPAPLGLCRKCKLSLDQQAERRAAHTAAFLADPSAYIAEHYTIFGEERLQVWSPGGWTEVYEPGEPAFEAATATATTDWLDQWL